MRVWVIWFRVWGLPLAFGARKSRLSAEPSVVLGVWLSAQFCFSGLCRGFRGILGRLCGHSTATIRQSYQTGLQGRYLGNLAPKLGWGFFLGIFFWFFLGVFLGFLNLKP